MKLNKLLAIVASGIVLMSFTACDQASNDKDATETTKMSQETPLKTEEATNEEATLAPAESFQADDFVGTWEDSTSKRAFMTITKNGDSYNVDIEWGSSASESTQWLMVCAYDENSNSLVYSNGIKNTNTSDENGNITSTEEYSDATGTLSYSNGTVTWSDSNDSTGSSCKFIKSEY